MFGIPEDQFAQAAAALEAEGRRGGLAGLLVADHEESAEFGRCRPGIVTAQDNAFLHHDRRVDCVPRRRQEKRAAAARGEVVDGAALKAALAAGRIRAALDVFENEPAGGEAPFADTELAGLLAAASPHIGASTDQAEEAIAEETVRVARTFLETGKPVNAVNPRKLHSGVPLVIRHYNRVGVLAGVLGELRAEGINIEEMENTIFEGELAACCALVLDKTPSEALMQRIGKAENVIQAALK